MTSGGTPVLKSHESDPKNLNAFNTQESWGGGGGGWSSTFSFSFL